MPQLKITRAAFNNMNMCCGDVSISDEGLSHPDMFLPVLLLLVVKTLSKKVLLDKMVTYDLVFNKDSLFYIEAKNIVIKNDDIMVRIIENMKGVESISPLFDQLADKGEEKNRYDLKRMCEYIRGKLSESEEGKVFDRDTSFEFLFDHITTSSLSEAFINEQNELLNSADIFDIFDDIDTTSNEGETTNSQPFSVTDTYPKLNSEDKKIFDELAVLACAIYLSENPSKSNVTDIEKDVSLPIDELVLLAAIVSHEEILTKVARKSSLKKRW